MRSVRGVLMGGTGLEPVILLVVSEALSQTELTAR